MSPFLILFFFLEWHFPAKFLPKKLESRASLICFGACCCISKRGEGRYECFGGVGKAADCVGPECFSAKILPKKLESHEPLLCYCCLLYIRVLYCYSFSSGEL